MFLKPSLDFEEQKNALISQHVHGQKSFSFLFNYIRQYRKYFLHILIGLLLGCLLQLIMPFLTQSIVDVGIARKNIGFIWMVLLGELMIIIGRTVMDFIRRWLLLHISMRINISLVSDFFIKLLKLPMSFFDTKLMGDLLQRILIARAVYKNPEFIFLDEATNSLDAKNERAIVENLEKFYRGRTVVVVAHRLSTVRNADQIIVLDDGKVVETGNHASLTEQKGVYYNLVKNQLELGN